MADITAKTPTPTPSPIQTTAPVSSAPPTSEPARADYLSDLAEAAASGDTARYEELVKEHQAETQELQRQADEASDAPIREPEPELVKPAANVDVVGAIPSDSQLIVKGRDTGILYRVDAPPDQVREVARFVQETDMSPADAAREQTARWERSVLPTLPQPYQKAYRDRDAAEMSRLATQYQQEQESQYQRGYNKLPSQFTPQDIKEVQSGQYKVFDYDSGKFVNVTKERATERERFYERYPFIGPPKTPGKITPSEAQATLTALGAYKVGDKYNLVKLAYDADKTGDKSLLDKARIIFGTAMDTAQESVRPSKAWWYSDPNKGNRLISDSERQQLITDRGYKYVEEKTARSLDGMAALLTRSRLGISSWSGEGSVTPSISYLNSIASTDFFTKGGNVKDRFALDNAIRAAGFSFPSGSGAAEYRKMSLTDKQKVVDAWGASGPIENLAMGIVVPEVGKVTSNIASWATSQKSAAARLPASVAAGITNRVAASLVAVPSVVLSAIERGVSGNDRASVEMLSNIPIGALEWATVTAAKRIREDPVSGIGMLIGEVFGQRIVSNLAKAAWNAPKVLSGKQLRVTSIQYNPDVERVPIRPGMTERVAQSVVQQVTEVMNKHEPSVTTLHGPGGHTALALKLGGRVTIVETMPRMSTQNAQGYLDSVWKGNVPKGMVVYSPDMQVAITEAITGRSAISSVAGLGGGEALKTAWNRVMPSTGFHATKDLTPFIDSLRTKGYYTVESGARPVEFMSPQFSESFRARSPLGDSGGLAQFYSVNDLQPIPADLIGDATNPGIPFQYIQDELMKRASAGAIPQGIYPVFKWYHSKEYGIPTYELEFVATPGFKWVALKPEWFMPKDIPVASIEVPGSISYTDPATGKQIKAGDPYKMLFVASENAIKDGVKAPTLAQLMAVWALDSTVGELTRLLSSGSSRAEAASSSEIATSQPTSISSMRLWKPSVIQQDKAAMRLRQSVRGKPQEPFTNQQMSLLGEMLDSKGKIVRARERYFHPQAESVNPKYGWVSSRVAAVVRDPATGAVLLLNDVAEPAGVFNVGGGQIDVLGKPRVPGRELGKVSPEEAVREQWLSEVGIDLNNLQRLPIYLGKTTEHSIPGTYMFLAEPSSSKLNINPDGKLEIREARWVKSGEDATVTPATYDILRSLEGFDVSKLKIYDKGWSKSYLEVRDKEYADRVDWNMVKTVSPTSVPKAQHVTVTPKSLPAGVSVISTATGQVITGKIPSQPTKVIGLEPDEGILPYRPDSTGDYPYPPMTVMPESGELYPASGEVPVGGYPQVSLETRVVEPEIRVGAEVTPEFSPETVPEQPVIDQPVESTPEQEIEPIPEQPIEPTPEPPTESPVEPVVERSDEPVVEEPTQTRLAGVESSVHREVARLPEGSIAYKKGLFWKWIPPEDFRDGVKPRTLPRGVSPIGADLSGGNSPYTTIQRIGKSDAVVPDRISIDEGVADAFIIDGGTKIAYGGKGEDTNVGERDDSPTQGMTVDGNGGGISRPDMSDIYPEHSVSRTAITARETSRAVKGVNRPKIATDTQRMLDGTYEDKLFEDTKLISLEPKTTDNDFSDLVELSDKDIDDILGVDVERDIMGDYNEPVNRTRHKKTLPRRGTDSPPTTVRSVRL